MRISLDIQTLSSSSSIARSQQQRFFFMKNGKNARSFNLDLLSRPNYLMKLLFTKGFL